MSTKVSIVVPIYNTAKYLPACLDSILAQTHQDLEIILIDDGSTDESGQIADTYAKKDKRIKVIHQKNAGQSSARNRGIKEAKGEYIGFVDSDDLIEPEFVSSLLKLYDGKTSIAVCGNQYRRLKENTSKNLYQSPLKPRGKNESKKAYIVKLLVKDGRMYACHDKLFNKEYIDTHHLLFDTNLNFAEDTKFVLDYLSYAKGEIAYDMTPLYIYNFGTDTSTIRSTATDWKNWQKQYEDLKTWLGKNPSIREKFWLHTVKLRWRVSHVRSKRRAKQ